VLDLIPQSEEKPVIESTWVKWLVVVVVVAVVVVVVISVEVQS
jgi:hypothetical protein